MTTSLTIHNDEEAFKLIREALDGAYQDDIVELNFDNWPTFEITVRGSRYDSTLTTSMMRTMVEMQRHLHRVYAEAVYGKTAKALSQEERDALELLFRVEEGSSGVKADLSEFFNNLAQNAVDKMTGRQIMVTVLGVAVVWGSASVYEGYLTSEEAHQKEQNRHELTMELAKQDPRVGGVNTEHQALMTDLLRAVSDADEVEVPGAILKKQDLADITRRERQISELQRIDGQYHITLLKQRQDRYRVEIVRTSDEATFNAELMKGHLTQREMTAITDSFLKEHAIHLNVVATVRGDAISSANIVGVNNQAGGQEVDRDAVNSAEIVQRSQGDS